VPSISPELEKGRAAYEARAWTEARDALSAAHEVHALSHDDLRRLGMAAYLVGDEATFLHALQEAHQRCADANDAAGAARYAFWLGFHLVNRREAAQANGWFARGSRWVQRSGGGCAEEGLLLLPQAMRHVMAAEYSAAADVAGRAAALGERHHEPDLLAMALHVQGRALLRLERVEEGLALLDEAMVAVAAGELSPQVTGIIYCGVISACREVGALQRAHEWTAALTTWCEGQPDMVPYAGECRVYRAEILQSEGRWEEAMHEARRALEFFARGPESAGRGLALYRTAELHRLRGQLSQAEDAYRAASLAGRQPQPGLALLRMAQGDAEAGAVALDRALAETADGLRRARLLPAYVETLLELDRVDDAARASRELSDVAERVGTGTLRTVALEAAGAVALAAGDPRGALGNLRKACEAWRGADAPYEAARARVLLAQACRALGDEDGARLELEAARADFERLGAELDEARAAALVHGRVVRDRHGLTPREIEVIALLATGRTNRAIAERLSISEKTVARHVANIFQKIGVSSRAAATAFAYEHGMAGPPAT